MNPPGTSPETPLRGREQDGSRSPHAGLCTLCSKPTPRPPVCTGCCEQMREMEIYSYE